MLVHRTVPLNSELSIADLSGSDMIPNARFYVRNHFRAPRIEAERWRLDVRGLVERPLQFTLQELLQLPSETAVVTLECAGNGRYAFDPPVPGEPWQLGAVSTAEWTGVPLEQILERAGVKAAATEIVFRGADFGRVDGHVDPIHFERSLSVATARARSALVAYAMNGEPLPRHHGYPVRLVVPGWYGVASVKWLTAIELVDRPFDGHYQVDKYWFVSDRGSREPCTLQRVRALITAPLDGAHVAVGDVTVRGLAWSGEAPIQRVDVSIDNGGWKEARLIGEARFHSWQHWEHLGGIDRSGWISIRARATDRAGRTQPERTEWNRDGYGNNAIQEVRVAIGASATALASTGPYSTTAD